MKNVIVAPLDVNYAASKTSLNANTALNPYDLADGAIGIYGIHKAGNTNFGKLVLIIDGGSEAAGVVPAADFVGDQITVSIGTSLDTPFKGDPINANALDVEKIVCLAQAYTPANKGVFSVGYNPSSGDDGQSGVGSSNFPTSIFNGDEAFIKAVDQSDKDELKTTGRTYSGYARQDNDDEIEILNRLALAVDKDIARTIEVEVTAKSAITDFAQDPTFTNGSSVVSFAGNVTIQTGSFIGVRGVIYKVAEGVSAGTSITLEREFKGSTVTVDVSVDTGHAGVVGTVTEVGLLITDKEDNAENKFSIGQILESADTNTVTVATKSSGSGLDVLEEEEDNLAFYGRLDQIDRRLSLKQTLTDSSLNYDVYNLSARNVTSTSDPHQAGHGVSSGEFNVMIALLTGVADTTGKNKSDLEDILTALGVNVQTLF